jgi:HEAT repeat protein
MRKWLLILLIIVVVAGGLVAWFEPTCTLRGKLRGEAFFMKRPTCYWQKRLESEDPIDQDQAPKQLQAGGAAAVPVLIELTRSNSTTVRVDAASLLARVGAGDRATTDALLHLLIDPDLYVRQTADSALGELHPDDPRVVPALIARLGGAEKAMALWALAEYKSAARAAVPRLIELLQSDPDTGVRWGAARTLGKIGPDAKPATDALIKALKDENGTLREHAAEALGEIGAEVAVPDLTALLDDPDPRVRRDSVRSLGQLGAAAKPAIPKIQKLLQDAELPVRQAAEVALRQINRPGPIKSR